MCAAVASNGMRIRVRLYLQQHTRIFPLSVCLFYLVRYLVMMRYDIGFTPRYVRHAIRSPHTDTHVCEFEDISTYASQLNISFSSSTKQTQ